MCPPRMCELRARFGAVQARGFEVARLEDRLMDVALDYLQAGAGRERELADRVNDQEHALDFARQRLAYATERYENYDCICLFRCV